MESLITANIRSRPTRTFISVLAVALGVVLMLIIGGITTGTLNDYIERTMGVGADFILQSSGASALYAFSGAALPAKLANKLLEVRSVSVVAPVLAKFNAADWSLVFGIDLESYNKLPGRLQIVSGAESLKDDEVIVDDLFAKSHKVGLGSPLIVLNHKFTISGVCRPGAVVRVFVPLKTLQEMNATPGMATTMFIKVAPGASVEAVEKELRSTYPDYTLISTRDAASLLSGTRLPLLKEFRFAVVLVSMLLSFMVILLAMYTTIFERTREIGILKSLGASRRFIVAMILKESVIICSLGVGVGIGMSEIIRKAIISAFPTLQVTMALGDVFNGCILGLIGGTMGALYPAYKAARMDPVKALSYE